MQVMTRSWSPFICVAVQLESVQVLGGRGEEEGEDDETDLELVLAVWAALFAELGGGSDKAAQEAGAELLCARHGCGERERGTGSTEGTRGEVLTVGVLGDVRRRVFEHGELRGGAERQEVGDERVVGVAEVDNGLRGGRRSQLADYWAEWKGSGTYRPSVAQEGEAHRAERGRRVGCLEAVQQRVRSVHCWL